MSDPLSKSPFLVCQKSGMSQRCTENWLRAGDTLFFNKHGVMPVTETAKSIVITENITTASPTHMKQSKNDLHADC